VRSLGQFLILVGIFVASYWIAISKFASPFWANFSISTASACLFYAVFTTWPQYKEEMQNKKRCFELLCSLYQLAISFDKSFQLTDLDTYQGYAGGFYAELKKQTNASYIAFKFEGLLVRHDRKPPAEAVAVFCCSALEIIHSLEGLNSPLYNELYGELYTIKLRVDDYLTRSNQLKAIQPTRGAIWRQLDTIHARLKSSRYGHEFFIFADGRVNFSPSLTHPA